MNRENTLKQGHGIVAAAAAILLAIALMPLSAFATQTTVQDTPQMFSKFNLNLSYLPRAGETVTAGGDVNVIGKGTYTFAQGSSTIVCPTTATIWQSSNGSEVGNFQLTSTGSYYLNVTATAPEGYYFYMANGANDITLSGNSGYSSASVEGAPSITNTTESSGTGGTSTMTFQVKFTPSTSPANEISTVALKLTVPPVGTQSTTYGVIDGSSYMSYSGDHLATVASRTIQASRYSSNQQFTIEPGGTYWAFFNVRADAGYTFKKGAKQSGNTWAFDGLTFTSSGGTATVDESSTFVSDDVSYVRVWVKFTVPKSDNPKPNPNPTPTPAPDPTPAVGKISMFRLYNPNSGEHFYTAAQDEHDNLVGLGWNDEGYGWVAPETSSTPVYRLYNPYGGEHHYTMDASERDNLVSVGWNDEGTGWYSDDAKGQVLYREYNPNAYSNNHNYTTDETEHGWLIGLGWQDEGTAWYGLAG